LGFYVTFNVVKLILISFLKFQHVIMMVFNVCVNETVQLLYELSCGRADNDEL